MPRARHLLQTLDVDGISADLAQDVVASTWHEWASIVTAGATTCLVRGPVGKIVATSGGTVFVHDVWAEAAAVSAAAGCPVPDDAPRTSSAMLTQPASSFVSSLHRDVVAGCAGEREHVLGDFTTRARSLAVGTPLLDPALMRARIATS